MAASIPKPFYHHFQSDRGPGLRERFWAKVTVRGPDDCWEWTAKASTKGYGSMKVTSTKQAISQRIAWAIYHDRDPGELYVLHSCDNPPCCNPAHLRLGTIQDNSDDMMSRGRHKNVPLLGEDNPRAKLTAMDIATIIAGFRLHMGNDRIAAQVNVGHSMISRIRVGLSWKREAEALGWVPEPQFTRKPNSTGAAA